MTVYDNQFKCKKTTRHMSSTPLHSAAERGDVDQARELLDHDRYDVNCTDEHGQTPLHWACIYGHVDMVRMLISEFQADTTLQDNGGYTSLHKAACRGKEDAASTLITEFGCDTTLRGRNGGTLLHSACGGGCLTLAKRLICDHDAEVNAQDENNDTPLRLAAREGKENLALALITEFGCDINISGQYCGTLLHSASWGGCLTLAKKLIQEYNVDVNAQDKNKDTPLHLAARNNKQDLALALIEEFGCATNMINRNGYTFLHEACIFGKESIVKRFGKYASLLATTNDGDTPLHIAAANGNEVCVEALLQLNPPIMLRNAAGKTARDLAILGVKQQLYDYFTQNEAKIYIHYDIILQQAKNKYSSAEHIIRIFVIGNPGAGKSSFVETMKREGLFESLVRVSESSVPPHTAGIVPSIYTSKYYGRVLFYDFAGDPEYYSSHAAILENLASSSRGDNIFIIVVDLREDYFTTRKILHYWLSFIDYQHGMKKLIVIGSHSDLVLPDDKIREISEFQSEPLEIDCFTLNCCVPRSKELEEIKSKIVHLTKDSPRYKLSTEATVLLGLLDKDFGNVTACSAKTILSHIKATGVSLSKDITLLMPILEELHDLGLLFKIKDSRRGSVQVILNISQFTNEVLQSVLPLLSSSLHCGQA